MEMKKNRYVGQSIVKKDAAALLSGKPVYTDDFVPDNALVVKLLKSPHAFAKIKNIDTSKAMLVPGVEIVVTYKDVPKKRFTLAGQTFPEPSPYDRLILDEYVRFVGDPVAIIAGKDEACCQNGAGDNGLRQASGAVVQNQHQATAKGDSRESRHNQIGSGRGSEGRVNLAQKDNAVARRSRQHAEEGEEALVLVALEQFLGGGANVNKC